MNGRPCDSRFDTIDSCEIDFISIFLKSSMQIFKKFHSVEKKIMEKSLSFRLLYYVAAYWIASISGEETGHANPALRID